MVNESRHLVEHWFPISSVIKQSLSEMMTEIPSIGVAVAVLALLPAVCEELAFRGFILSGLEYHRRTRSAILLSALMFGFLHVLMSLFQQLFNATLLGVVLGLLAVRSRSLLPGIVFHFLNNVLAITQASWLPYLESAGVASWLYRTPAEGLYHGVWVAFSGLVSALCSFTFGKLTVRAGLRDDPEFQPAF